MRKFLQIDDTEKLDKIFARHKDNATYRIVEEKALIVNSENNAYFFLNEVGAQIWESLRENKSLAQIAREIARFYKVGYQDVARDLIELANELIDAELLELKIVDV